MPRSASEGAFSLFLVVSWFVFFVFVPMVKFSSRRVWHLIIRYIMNLIAIASISLDLHIALHACSCRTNTNTKFVLLQLMLDVDHHESNVGSASKMTTRMMIISDHL